MREQGLACILAYQCFQSVRAITEELISRFRCHRIATCPFLVGTRHNLKSITIARITIAAVPASLVLLFFAQGGLWQLVAFTLLLGPSQGVIHHRPGYRPARAVRHRRVRRDARVDRDTQPARQRILAGALCPASRSIWPADFRIRPLWPLDRYLDRH
jgi:hypothetical protein